MVNRSKKIDVNEIIKPDIINGLDLTSSILRELFDEDNFLSFFLNLKLERGFITIKLGLKIIALNF